jgi:hypothetical protein
VTATGAVATGSISALGVGFFLGGAGVEPGDWTAGITFPSTAPDGASDEIYLVRNVPISRVQDYYADITGISVNCDVSFILREYEANGDYTDNWGGPGVTTLATPGWVGDSAPIFAVGPNTVSADLLLTVAPSVYGQPASVQITQPVLALTGFVSRDSNRQAVFSPDQLMMQGRAVSVYISSVDGLATIQAGDASTSQDQGLVLGGFSKIASLWSGASAVVEMLMAKARIAFGAQSWLELTSTLADLRGPSVNIGDGSNNIKVTGKVVTGADLSSASNTFPATLVKTNLPAGLNIRAGSAATNGTQTITVTHGLGTTPTWVIATGNFSTTTYYVIVTAKSATTFTIQILPTTSTPAGGLSVGWICGV